jgi:hypothetical protein
MGFFVRTRSWFGRLSLDGEPVENPGCGVSPRRGGLADTCNCKAARQFKFEIVVDRKYP